MGKNKREPKKKSAPVQQSTPKRKSAPVDQSSPVRKKKTVRKKPRLKKVQAKRKEAGKKRKKMQSKKVVQPKAAVTPKKMKRIGKEIRPNKIGRVKKASSTYKKAFKLSKGKRSLERKMCKEVVTNHYDSLNLLEHMPDPKFQINYLKGFYEMNLKKITSASRANGKGQKRQNKVHESSTEEDSEEDSDEEEEEEEEEEEDEEEEDEEEEDEEEEDEEDEDEHEDEEGKDGNDDSANENDSDSDESEYEPDPNDTDVWPSNPEESDSSDDSVEVLEPQYSNRTKIGLFLTPGTAEYRRRLSRKRDHIMGIIGMDKRTNKQIRKPCIRCCGMCKGDKDFGKHSRKGRNSSIMCVICDVVLCNNCFDEFHQQDVSMPPCYNSFRVKPGPKRKECVVIQKSNSKKMRTVNSNTSKKPQSRVALQNSAKENSSVSRIDTDYTENSTGGNMTVENRASVVHYSDDELDNSGVHKSSASKGESSKDQTGVSPQNQEVSVGNSNTCPPQSKSN